MLSTNGKLVMSSRLLWTVERERDRKIHEKRLREINKRRPRRRGDSKKQRRHKRHGLQRGIDCHIERGNYKHILENRKGAFIKAQEQKEIKRINRLLLDKLQAVFSSDSPFDEMNPEMMKPKSMNITQRRRELMRINEENKAMLKRLEGVEPTFSARCDTLIQ